MRLYGVSAIARQERGKSGTSSGLLAIVGGATLVALATVIAIAVITVAALSRTQGGDATATVREVLPVLAALGGGALGVAAVAVGIALGRGRHGGTDRETRWQHRSRNTRRRSEWARRR